MNAVLKYDEFCIKGYGRAVDRRDENTQFLVFNTNLLVFNTKFLVFNTKFLVLIQNSSFLIHNSG